MDNLELLIKYVLGPAIAALTTALVRAATARPAREHITKK